MHTRGPQAHLLAVLFNLLLAVGLEEGFQVAELLIWGFWNVKKISPSGRCMGINFVDSTHMYICRNQRIRCHKVFKVKGIALRVRLVNPLKILQIFWFFRHLNS